MSRRTRSARRPVGPLRRGRAPLRRRVLAGATFLYFGLIGLPALFFGASMAVDFTRIIIAAREMHNAAEASALAGAYQFQDASQGDPTKLNSDAAKSAARDTLCRAAEVGQVHLTTFTCADAEAIAPQLNPAGTTVTVTVRYKVDGLVFSQLLGNLLGSGQNGSSGGYQVTAKAFVCNPTVTNGPTQGFCVRPGQWR